MQVGVRRDARARGMACGVEQFRRERLSCQYRLGITSAHRPFIRASNRNPRLGNLST